jgi:hypothetical protein
MIKIVKAGDGNVVLSPFVNVTDQGTWEVTLNTDLPFGDYSIMAQMSWSGYLSAFSPGVPLKVGIPTITSPIFNQIVPSHEIVFRGGGYPGSTITVVKQANHYDTVSVPTTASGTTKAWEAAAKATPLQPSGYLTVEAQYKLGSHGYSDPMGFWVLGAPAISAPAAISEQDQVFTLTGNNGLAGAKVEIFKDLTQTKVGGSGVLTSANWSVQVTVDPGSQSLVALQSHSGKQSSRGAPRSFKIRPPAFTAVNVESPTETSVRFSGIGHTGAIVEITKKSGPGGQTLPSVTVVNGVWQVDATNWSPGQYSFSATQKVSDNNSGWIVSTPYTFTCKWELPVPTNVRYTRDYAPIFSGNGYNGATVELFNPNRVDKAAPDVLVTGGGWSSQASTVWGPTLKREVHLRQRLGQVVSDGWVVLQVTIAPLAPVITEMIDNEYTPIFKGTCWAGALVNLKFSDDPKVYPAVVQSSTWTYTRPTPFEAEITHTVTVTQRAAGQDSPSTLLSFSVNRSLPTPVFTAPEVNEEVGRDLLVEGMDGVAGGQVQLKDAQFTGDLGKSAFLTMDGYWSVALQRLEFREYRVKAVQVMGSRESLPTDVHVFKVVVLPPVIEVPAPGEAIARTAIVSGVGMSGARVDVYLEGVAEPLLRDLLVNSAGHWRSEAVTLEIGHKALRARQTFEGRPSKDSPRQAFRVVPAAPSIETPVAVGQVGRQVVVSGFGYAGDEVVVAFGDEPDTVLGRALVRNDRTWSVAVELNRPGGNYSLIAVQSRGEFHSSPSEDRPVVLGSYRPSVDVPAPGRWVSDPVGFAGQGQTGTGVLVSWYNPERVLANDIVVTDEGWKSQAGLRFPPGGQWVRFKQVIHREVSWTYSDWAESARFEVVSSPPELKA